MSVDYERYRRRNWGSFFFWVLVVITVGLSLIVGVRAAIISLIIGVPALLVAMLAWKIMNDVQDDKETEAEQRRRIIEHEKIAHRRAQLEKICEERRRYYERNGYTLVSADTVPCVICNAKPGEHCCDEDGRVKTDFHDGRFVGWNPDTGDAATPMVEYLSDERVQRMADAA
jgi:hypothetical protein